jgi:hypothetical protein
LGETCLRMRARSANGFGGSLSSGGQLSHHPIKDCGRKKLHGRLTSQVRFMTKLNLRI